jgi:hypothetical protein
MGETGKPYSLWSMSKQATSWQNSLVAGQRKGSTTNNMLAPEFLPTNVLHAAHTSLVKGSHMAMLGLVRESIDNLPAGKCER